MYNQSCVLIVCGLRRLETGNNFYFPRFAAQSCETPAAPASNQSPNPNNPAEYCSTIPPLQQAEASGVLSSPPPTVMVPVGVLKQSGSEGIQPLNWWKVL